MSDSEVIGAAAASEPAVVIETAGGVIPRAPTSELLTHGGITIPHFFAMHVTGAGFPLVAGLLLYGWRALGALAMVVLSAALAVAVWRRIGARGEQLRYSHSLWLALLLGLTLPPHLFDVPLTQHGDSAAAWPLAASAGLLIVPLIWLLGGLGSGRLHPVLIAHLLLMGLFGSLLTSHSTLQRHRIFVGDVLDAPPPERSEPLRGRWISAAPLPEFDAVRAATPASTLLTNYTSPRRQPSREAMSMETLIRDAMPPLEDLILGGHPGPIGTSCAIAVIIGGLFMLYRGVIDYRIPLLIILAAYLAILVLPVPIAIRETGGALVRDWRWLAIRQSGVSPAVALTFAHYELMASPLLFMAFFLATSPAIRPLVRRARTLYALLVGFLAAAMQLYVSVAIGAYLALLIAGVFAAALDRYFQPRTLV